MTVVFNDDFTVDVVDTIITSITPLTGTGYTEIRNTTTTTVESDATADEIRPLAFDGSDGMVYSMDPAPTEADVDVILAVSNMLTFNDDYKCLMARFVDVDNHYGIAITGDATVRAFLYKMVSATFTNLGTGATTPASGDRFKLKIRGTTIEYFIDDAGAGFTSEVSVTDTAISAAGKACIGWGDINGSTQFNTGDTSANEKYGAVSVDEFAAVGGANPKGPLGMPLIGPFGGPV